MGGRRTARPIGGRGINRGTALQTHACSLHSQAKARRPCRSRHAVGLVGSHRREPTNDPTHEWLDQISINKSDGFVLAEPTIVHQLAAGITFALLGVAKRAFQSARHARPDWRS